MKTKKLKLIFVSFILLILVVNFIEILDADYIDEVLEGVNEEKWSDVAIHYIKNPRPQKDNPQIINRLFEKDYAKALILETWKDLESSDAFSKINYRYELWETLNDENRKKLLTAFSSYESSEGKNLKELWSSSDNKDNYERLNQKNDILSLLNKDQKEKLIKEITKKDISLPKIDNLKIFYKELNNGFKKLEITDPKNKYKHIIPIDNLPSDLKKIEFAKVKGGDKYYTFYYFDDKEEKKVMLESGKYLQEGIPEGYDEKSQIYVEGYSEKDFPIINFGTSENAIIKISDKIEIWDNKADLTGKKASVAIGDETIFAHPEILTSNKDYSYASYEKSSLSDDVSQIRGAGRTLRNGGLGFYFENEGILDLDGKYVNKEKDKPILKFYKNDKKELIISGQTPSINNPVTFTLGKNANLFIGDKGLKLEAKDKDKNYFQYAILGNQVSLNKPANEYVPRLSLLRYLTNGNEIISNGENPKRISKDVQQAVSQAKPQSTQHPFSAKTKKSETTNSPILPNLLPHSNCRDEKCQIGN